MMDAQTLKFIKDEIKKQVYIILSGQSGTNDQFNEDIQEMYPGMPTITQRPVMHPYGISSRAPDGTIQVVARQGEHAGNRIVLGHRDAKRPSLNQGEVMLYNESGEQIYLKNGQIILTSPITKIGSSESAENLVLGQVFKDFMSTVLQQIALHTHTGNLGYPTSVPTNASQFTTLKASPIDDSAILSDKGFTEK